MRAGRLIAGAVGAGVLVAAAYAASSWYRYGRPARSGRRDELLDRFMPDYEVRERHEGAVAAPADLTFAAARELDLGNAPLVRGIFTARQLFMGGRGARSPAPPRPFVDETIALGWRVLAETPGRQLVFGAVTQPWHADVVFRGLPPEDFAAFAEPGYVKIVWTIEAAPLGTDASLFRTETRVVATDVAARARFRRYWAAVRPGIVMIRLEMLRQVRRRAERLARAGSP